MEACRDLLVIAEGRHATSFRYFFERSRTAGLKDGCGVSNLITCTAGERRRIMGFAAKFVWDVLWFVFVGLDHRVY